MKLSTVIVLLLMPVLATAQNYPAMNAMDMQKMQQMQSCMEKVDQGQLKTLEKRQHKFDAEVKSLCASGNRDEAQTKAVSFGKEMKSKPAIKTMIKCGEIAKGMMPEMPFMKQQDDIASQHVCDSY